MDEITVEIEIADLIAKSSLDMVLSAVQDYCQTISDEDGSYTPEQYENIADLLGDCLHELEE